MDRFVNPYILLISLSFLSVSVLFRKRVNPNGLPLPPGPKGYPFIGCLFEFPTHKPWLVYDAWSKKYGDIIHFKVLGTSFIILNSLKRTNDLFEKRSSNYSDRVRMPMLVELVGWDWALGFIPYGQWWRCHRRVFHEYFYPNATTRYRTVQHREACKFIGRLSKTPDKFFTHIRHNFSATIMDVVYGIEVRDSNNQYVSIIESAMEGLNEAGVIGRFLVDLIPVLKYVPNWIPGAGFKQKAAQWSKATYDMNAKPFSFVKEKMKSGERAVPCVTTTMIERLPRETDPNYLEEESIARDVAAVAYLGGADTTLSTLQFFFLAMAMYPEVQKKAQAELDVVVSSDRLPEFSDRSSLPYINAIVKESMRWQLVLPLGVAHMCTDDDTYDGYYIPKGSIIMGNSWSILHNAEEFPEPEEYRPERYLKDGKLNPGVRSPDVAFGYGRRICPGRHLSDNSLFIIIALVLSVFNIEPPVNEQGHVIKLKPEVTSGLLSYPIPYNCKIKPRSSAAEALIRLVDEE